MGNDTKHEKWAFVTLTLMLVMLMAGIGGQFFEDKSDDIAEANAIIAASQKAASEPVYPINEGSK